MLTIAELTTVEISGMIGLAGVTYTLFRLASEFVTLKIKASAGDKEVKRRISDICQFRATSEEEIKRQLDMARGLTMDMERLLKAQDRTADIIAQLALTMRAHVQIVEDRHEIHDDKLNKLIESLDHVQQTCNRIRSEIKAEKE